MDNGRVLIKWGYNEYWLLPEGMKADQIRALVGSIKIQIDYESDKYYPSAMDQQIKIEIIGSDEISDFIVVCKREEYKLIAQEVKERIGDRKHRAIRFNKEKCFVGNERIDYIEDIADPSFDPEEIINNIVEMALAEK